MMQKNTFNTAFKCEICIRLKDFSWLCHIPIAYVVLLQIKYCKTSMCTWLEVGSSVRHVQPVLVAAAAA